jgi:leader peptidase (prepilin peptidase)/N-methyltransferase
MGSVARHAAIVLGLGVSLHVMPWWFHVPAALWCLWVFILGLGVGSFLNVLIARLPFEKSIVWPGSRCGTCYRPIRLLDNLPIVGYLRLRGRCRFCMSPFSSRYLWVELGTGLAFVALFLIEIVSQAEGGPEFLRPWHYAPGLRYPYIGSQTAGPTLADWAYFAAHACLLALLIAAAVIDAEHRVIPPQITYPGALIGLICSVAFPWPWPTDPAVVAQLPPTAWLLPDGADKIPTGLSLWPFAGPPPDWALPGSWQLGLMNGLVGAAVGTALVRVFKFLFEWGFGQEALGLGDADLLMMVGAFLGWQVALLGFFAGAFAALGLKIPELVWKAVRGRQTGGELPFGPGLVVGVVLVWLGWPRLGVLRQMLFDPVLIAVAMGIMCVGLLAAGMILRRPRQAAEA